MAHARAIRGGLVVLAISQAGPALWALAAPRSFYDDFPGFGHSWVMPLGPYDEHLVRDVGSTFTALLLILVLAAVFMERRLVQSALAAWLVYTVPHLIYHAATADRLSATDNVGNLGGIGLQVVLGASLLALSLRAPPTAAG